MTIPLPHAPGLRPTIAPRALATALAGLLACLAAAHALGAPDPSAAGRGLHRVPLEAVTKGGAPLELYRGSHALLVGTSRYETWGELPTIPSELDALEAVLTEQGFEVRRLVDPDARELRSGIQGFIDDHGYEPENRLLVFFSGHGHSIGDKGFLLPVDAPLPESPDFRRHALPMTRVMAWARDIEAKHVLFLFDSCFAGTVFEARSLPDPAERYIREVTAEPVRQFITAGRADEEVPAKSTFTPALVDAIRGEGDTNGDGYVTGAELGVHLSQLVPRFVAQTPQYGKIRDYELARGDFVFLPGDGRDAPERGAGTPTGSAAGADVEALLWSSAERDDTAVGYRAYLERHSAGTFAAIARDRLERLERAASVSVPTVREVLEAPPDSPFDLVAAASNLPAVRALLCLKGDEPESTEAARFKRDAEAVYSGLHEHRGAGDPHRGWSLYLDAIEHCSTSALFDIATKLLSKKACDVAIEYARLAAEHDYASAPRLVSQIERKPARACRG